MLARKRSAPLSGQQNEKTHDGPLQGTGALWEETGSGGTAGWPGDILDARPRTAVFTGRFAAQAAQIRSGKEAADS